jgi:hypothetical protein
VRRQPGARNWNRRSADEAETLGLSPVVISLSMVIGVFLARGRYRR